ncbi:hypothetical protein [Streptomyces sp. NPDC059278]|uniref:hypothetical protein n=1 Tax=Streptomyces sp. NPDC059278 TaxID=3346801 RepID=UPI0036975CD1
MKITISAHQWHANGDHPDDGPPGREGEIVRYFRHPGYPGINTCPRCHTLIHEHGWIDSGADGRTVCPGDWIITTPAGDHIPVATEAFFALVKELTTT